MSDEIELLVKRIYDAIRPRPLCRDCADVAVSTIGGERCPHSGELCSVNKSAKEISQEVYKLFTKLEATQGEDHGHYVENLLRDNADLAKVMKLQDERNAGLLTQIDEDHATHQRALQNLAEELRIQIEAGDELCRNIELIAKLHTLKR